MSFIKPGRRTKEWDRERAKLKKEYAAKGITTCELKKAPCWFNNALGFVHRHKRAWYYDKPGMLGKFNQTLLGCNPCHDLIENDKEETERVFMKLRGPEI